MIHIRLYKKQVLYGNRCMYVWCYMYAMYGNDFVHVCLSQNQKNKV